MVFSSVPVYLDPPSNWNQQQQQLQPNNNQLPTTSISITIPHEVHNQVPTMFSVSCPNPTGMSVATSSVRPSSMTDQARLTRLPQPEHGLKCPRCESTNTKFCYFNNYSLSQPRHFCKACKRYWTRGGALRNVPVGGGFRRNKRNKSSSSKSSANSTSASTTATAGGAVGSNIQPQGHHQLPFMTSLNPLPHDQFSASNFAQGLSRIHHPLDHTSIHDHHQYNQLGSSSTSVVAGSSSLEHHHQWRLQQITRQFPNFIGGGGSSCDYGLYSFDGDASSEGNFGSQTIPKVCATSTGLVTQIASVKMEDNNCNQNNHQGLSLPIQYMGLQDNNNDGGWNTGNLPC